MFEYVICPRCKVRYFQQFNIVLLRKSYNEINDALKDKYNYLEYSPTENNNVCVGCFNILKDESIKECINQIQDATKEFLFDSFKLMVTQPVQILVCNSLTICQLKEMQETNKNLQNMEILDVKDAFKAIAEPLLQTSLNSKSQQDADLEIHITFKHLKTEENVLANLELAKPKSFIKAKYQLQKQTRKRQRDDLSYFTIASVSDALSTMKYDEILSIFKIEYLSDNANIGGIDLCHRPLIIAGRYNKYSRFLSQTPWIIEGERKSEMSVEEYISGPIQNKYGSIVTNFSSSGREDCDVKTLGRGRPFIIEVINPKNFSTDKSIIESVQKEINSITDNIQVRDLQIITKAETKKLKEGEEEKTKSYAAYCYAKLNDTGDLENAKKEFIEKINKLSNTIDLKIFQKTPIRVLHRRSLQTRQRLIHNMKPEIVDLSTHELPSDKIFFKLLLTTQAGTYIKEFVHGDFNRTQPNLRTILNAEVDIINLDVTAVNVDWPKSIDD